MSPVREEGGPKRSDPRRERTDPPEVELDPEEQSTAAKVATFRTPRHQVGVPAAVLIALIAAISSAVIAWINKPAPPVASALTQEQAAQLQKCSGMAQDVAELKVTVRWIEPQIGILLARTDSRNNYAPSPPAPTAPRSP